MPDHLYLIPQGTFIKRKNDVFNQNYLLEHTGILRVAEHLHNTYYMSQLICLVGQECHVLVILEGGPDSIPLILKILNYLQEFGHARRRSVIISLLLVLITHRYLSCRKAVNKFIHAV